MGFEDLVKEMLPFVAWPHFPSAFASAKKKMVRGIPNFFLGEHSHLQYLLTKKTHQRPIISPPNMEVQKFEKKIPVFVRMPRPLSTP
jgi:hypothetical protein